MELLHWSFSLSGDCYSHSTQLSVNLLVYQFIDIFVDYACLLSTSALVDVNIIQQSITGSDFAQIDIRTFPFSNTVILFYCL